MGREYIIELARAEDLPALGTIERAAAALLAGWQVPAAVLADATSIDELRDAQEAGRLWVARNTSREP